MDSIDMIAMRTQDPQNNVPALTTLLYKVCDDDAQKFEEACRLVGLFIEQAVEEYT